MSTNLYFLNENSVEEMKEQSFESEDYLQKLIADNPKLLLPDEQKESVQLFLVQREFSIEEDFSGTNAFSLDHLFIDSDGIPVLVEVKRCSDTRIRREVVAQMLDYACRAQYWDIQKLRDSFPESAQPFESEQFWERVSANLKAERLKLVFAADHIPDSLKTIIDFLNRSMPSIDIYGVEIRRFCSGGSALLSSTVVCRKSIDMKPSYAAAEWTTEKMSSLIITICGTPAQLRFSELLNYAERQNLRYIFGKGTKRATVTFKKESVAIFRLNIENNRVCIELPVYDLLPYLPNWDEAHLRRQILNQLDDESGRSAALVRNTLQFIYIEMELLVNDTSWRAFQSSMAQIIENISV